jgi:hypothetical protein
MKQLVGMNLSSDKVIIAHLRRPRLNKPDEKRSDPFWEFGSFGCTRCHKHNLMNPKKIYLLAGARFAFAQGGDAGMRLVHLTPPVRVISHGHFAEVKWEPAEMPFRYRKAPLLIDTGGNSDFPLLKRFIEKTLRPTWPSKFSSRFRSRRTPLETDIACEMIDVFQCYQAEAGADAYAVSYVDALPYDPPIIDTEREKTYLCLGGSLIR